MNLLCGSQKGLCPTTLVHTMSNILNSIEKGASHIEALKSKVIKAKKVQLHSGLEGFESPEAFGIYRNSGGEPLGVVGKVYEPTDLVLFLDAIHHSVLSSGIDCDLTKLEYKELCGGSKVVFKLPYREFELKTPKKGDIVRLALEFRTGFDGKTKVSLGFSSLRLWCTNGAKNWQSDLALEMKNTANNQLKLLSFSDTIIRAAAETENYIQLLNQSAKISVSKDQINKFITELTGYNVAEYNDLTTRKRNILDKVNASIAVEMNNTGGNLFSLLQGVTRYTTHELSKGDEDTLFFGSASQMSDRAHRMIFAELN
jgi:hypothetical protein